MINLNWRMSPLFLIKQNSWTDEHSRPDQLIYEIAWKSIGEIRSLKMSFPEDRMFLINFMNQQQRKNWSEKNET